ncbi:MAG: hypothetical protein QGH11_03615, partial [Pirellulaceae bacterium]|nr:hypothetical protein [Pirellulaceae bacterium]
MPGSLMVHVKRQECRDLERPRHFLQGGKSHAAFNLPATETIIQHEDPVDQFVGQFPIPDFQR